MKFFVWNIPVNPSKCASLNHTIACPIARFSNEKVVLNQDQKLVPNDDITGRTIVRAFIATTCIALVLSCFLIYDKIKYHFFIKSRRAKDKIEALFYLRIVHTIESLLQTLSDQQLVAGIALLATINLQACEITAYHYNLVCTMLLLSAITHLNTFINIPDFIFRGKAVAAHRMIAVAIQIILSGIVLSARNTSKFPSKAGPLSILPAACFENMNATEGFGLGDFVDFVQNVTAGETANTTANATQILDNIERYNTRMSGLGEYITLVVFVILAALFLLLEWAEACWKPEMYVHWFSISLSTASVIASIVISAVAYHRYSNLRGGMEVDAWFNPKDHDKWTYAEIIPFLLLASGSITMLKAITESIAGQKARRYEQAAQHAANLTLNTKQRAQQTAGNVALVQQSYENTKVNYQYSEVPYDSGYGR